MRSTYKKLGPYIQEVVEKNSDLLVELLLGVSVSKEFIPSIANTIGTDMSRYKIVREKQFAYGPVTSRNSDKISIALLTEPECIISTSYTVFEIIDEDELLPEYLMMWFRRPEFDRYARFKSHGSVRELFGWEEMCDVELPIPSIEKQREIVKEYRTVVDRIRLNERLNEKLEETAQAIYKRWFIEFEFPMTAEYAESIGKSELAGQPYKSSGGEMEYNEVLEQEIPKGWRTERLEEVIESHSRTHKFEKDELIFFNTSDILDGSFLHENYSRVDSMPGQAKKSIRRGDILFSEIRPNNKRYAVVRVDAEDYVVSTKLMVLRLLRDTHSVLRVYHYLTSAAFILELQQAAEGRSGTFPQITFDNDIAPKPFLVADHVTESRWDATLNACISQIFARKDEIHISANVSTLLLERLATL